MNKKLSKPLYECPQVEVVDIYPEKAYCSGTGGSGEDGNNTTGGWN